jgi:hypothetical protein
MILSRSSEASPSNLLVSNSKFNCRLEVVAGNLRCVIVFLPNDRGIAPGVCGIGRHYQQSLQLDERRQIDVRRADGHSSANHRIEHPTGDRNHDAGRYLNFKKQTRRSLLHAPYGDFATKIGVPPIMDFQLLPDMGRMNG